MAQIIYDLIEPEVLINYVRTYDNEVLRPENKFTLDQWLPNIQTEDLDIRIRKGVLHDVDTAEYRAWDSPAPMTGRPGTTWIQGSLGPVSRQIPLGEEETLRLRALERGNNDPIITAIFDDAERMTRAVQARVEVARGDIIDDGKLTINENGLVLEADFGRNAQFSVVAPTLWSDHTSAHPLTDILGWQTTYFDINGVLPENMIINRIMLAHMQLNLEIRQYAAANGTTPQRVNQGTLDAIFASEGLPTLVLNDEKVRVNGASTRVLPGNKVYLMPDSSQPFGATYYGITAEAIKLASKGYITQEEAPGIVAVVTETEHPVQTFTVGTAIAMPMMPNPNLVMDAVVA